MQQRARKLRAAASLPSTPAPAVPVGGMRALTLEPPRCSTSVGKRQGSGGAAAGSSQAAAARGQAQGGGATTQRRCECGPAAGDTGGLRGSGDAAGAPAADAGHARADGGESRSGSVPRSMSSGSLQGARRCAADAA